MLGHDKREALSLPDLARRPRISRGLADTLDALALATPKGLVAASPPAYARFTVALPAHTHK